jgi:hypothetical protein
MVRFGLAGTWPAVAVLTSAAVLARPDLLPAALVLLAGAAWICRQVPAPAGHHRGFARRRWGVADGRPHPPYVAAAIAVIVSVAFVVIGVLNARTKSGFMESAGYRSRRAP